MFEQICVLSSILFVSGLAHAEAPTSFEIQTIDGKTVKVSEGALQTSYSKMVEATFNNTFKNEDGSTSIVRPAVMAGGTAHAVALENDIPGNYAVGLCKLRGFATSQAAESDWVMAPGPTAILREDGAIDETNEAAVGNIYAYRSIICR